MSRNPSDISPTAHYTGLVWARNGLSHPALETGAGRFMFYLFKPVVAAARLAGMPPIDSFLVTRHKLIDLRLARAIESGAVTQVIEIAAGLSPRGWRFTQRFGERLRYVEADLPGMAQRKREALAGMGPMTAGHQVVDIDALVEEGPMSLAAIAASLDREQGLAIVTEGLLNYFSESDVRSMWSRFSRTLGQFRRGMYWSDLFLSSDMRDATSGPFLSFLSVFVRGRVHLHFDSAAAAESALRESGFSAARLLDPGEFQAALADVPGGVSRRVRIVEASALGPRAGKGEQGSPEYQSR